jgi:hypothetical protein
MNPLSKRSWCVLGLAALCLAVGCQRAPAPDGGPAVVQADAAAFEIAGPFAHENLSVFLLQAEQQDDRAYLTLDQGLKDGSVAITEKGQEQVSELQIDNRSGQYLFLQEGDRIQGGKQDRIIITSLVVPPHSGPMPVPANCIEQGRWSRGVSGSSFAGTANTAYAPKEVRQAAKGLDGTSNTLSSGNNQSRVWEGVRRTKAVYGDALGAANTNSSLNETLDDPKVKKLSDEFAAALAGALQEHPKAVGVAIVVNGKIEEVNVYPNHDLLGKVYPRLLQSYALQAALEKDKAKDAPAMSVADVKQFMTEGQQKGQRTDPIDTHNRLQVSDFEGKAACQTEYDGKPVHRQWMTRSGQDQPRESPNNPMPNRPEPPNNAPPP